MVCRKPLRSRSAFGRCTRAHEDRAAGSLRRLRRKHRCDSPATPARHAKAIVRKQGVEHPRPPSPVLPNDGRVVPARLLSLLSVSRTDGPVADLAWSGRPGAEHSVPLPAKTIASKVRSGYAASPHGSSQRPTPHRTLARSPLRLWLVISVFWIAETIFHVSRTTVPLDGWARVLSQPRVCIGVLAVPAMSGVVLCAVHVASPGIARSVLSFLNRRRG